MEDPDSERTGLVWRSKEGARTPAPASGGTAEDGVVAGAGGVLWPNPCKLVNHLSGSRIFIQPSVYCSHLISQQAGGSLNPPLLSFPALSGQGGPRQGLARRNEGWEPGMLCGGGLLTSP